MCSSFTLPSRYSSFSSEGMPGSLAFKTPDNRLVSYRDRSSTSPEGRMDKKAKKRLDIINKKLQTLRPRLAGSKQQADDPDELKQLEDEVAQLQAEAAELKSAK